MSKLAEQQTEWIISNILVNNGWIIDSKPEKNVYFQKAKPEHQSKLEILSKKKGYKKPDYILYQGSQPIGIIEAKRGGEPLVEALKQATEYAEMLEAPLIFASNGAYVETNHLARQRPLFINGDKVDKIIRYQEAISFIEKGDNEIYTISPELIKSKEDLIRVFKNVNNLLRKANIFSGYDRISEFSSILFLKLISEKDGEKSYWNSIKKQDDDFLLSYLNGTVIKELESKYGGGVFSEINIKKPSLFRQIMDMLDPLILSDIKTDIKGDAFEYFLKNMNQADNDLGQYFTPRHVVQAMVHLVNPKFKETVYDPFCGTGGFLIESFNHIKREAIIDTDEDKKILTEKTLFGVDATKVSTIAKKNMILHGDGHSNIKEQDSLENPINNKYKTLITNIPFSLKDVDYTNLYYNGIGKKNGDAVCVLHCLQALEKGGRMAIIVPEGFLFKKELKEVRKFLLSKANLELVVSLPSGIFQPYTGVKTDILYFTNAHSPEKREGYYYFEVKNDGFTLDAHRRKIEGKHDIHTLRQNNINKTEKELLKAEGFEFIPFEKIEQNDYNLVGTRYREIKMSQKWKMARVSDVAELLNGYAFKSEFFSENSGFPLIRIRDIKTNKTQTKYNNNDYDDKYIVENGDLIIGMDGEFNAVTWNGGSALLNQRVCKLIPNSKILPSYLFHLIRNPLKEIEDCTTFTTVKHISSKQILDILIPLPPLEEQQKIVAKLDAIQKSIQDAKNLIESLKQGGAFYLLFGNENVEFVELGKICKIYRGGSPRPIEKFITHDENGINWLKIGDINQDEKYIYSTTEKITPEGVKYSRLAKNGDFILSNSMSFGRPYILKTDACIHDGWLLFTAFSSRIDKDYLYCVISSNFVKEQFENFATGSTVKNLNISIVESVKIPLPSLNEQIEISEKFEAELSCIKSIKQIIKNQQEKMNLLVKSLWR